MFAMQTMALKRSMKTKKGLSPVVATLALVMITVAAAVFIAGFVVPLVKNSLNEGTECLGYEDYFTFYEEFDYNCYKIENRVDGKDYIYAFSIEAQTVPQEKLDEIGALRIQFLGDGESWGISVADALGADSETGGIRMLDAGLPELTVPEKGGVKTYVYNSSVELDSVEIYPVLKNGRICEQSDRIGIKGNFCGPNTLWDV